MFKEMKVKRGLDKITTILDFLKDKEAFICGGYARYCLSPKSNPIAAVDVDIYSRNVETFEVIKAYFKDQGFEIRHENDLAITYKKKDGIFKKPPTFQVIKPFIHNNTITVGTVEEILSHFDFTVVRCALIYKNGEWIGFADEDFETDESTHFLRIKNIHCPISSLMRFMKYGSKGYFTRPAQLMLLFQDWDNRDESYRATIMEKLVKINGDQELTHEEINELEALLRID